MARPNLDNQENIVLSVIAGDNDYIHPYNLGFDTNFPVIKQNEASGGYRTVPQYGWSNTFGVITFNMSIEDDVLRELFNNLDFRIALSIAIDRDEINEVVYNGLYKPSQVAPPDSSVYNGGDPGFKVHTEFDPDRANEILDSLGLTWNDNRTQRLLPDGRPFALSAQVHTAVATTVPVTELIAQNWEDIGLSTTLVPLPGDLHTERRTAGDYELQVRQVNWGGVAPIIGAMRGEPVPISTSWLVNPPWAQWVMSGGAEGEEPPVAVKRLYEIFEEFVAEPDPQVRFELETEMYKIHQDNMWIIGTIKQPADLPALWYTVFSNRMYNIPNPVAPEWYYAVPETWAYRSE